MTTPRPSEPFVIQHQDHTLLIILTAAFSQLQGDTGWFKMLPELPAAPPRRLIIDIGASPMLHSAFFAGALHLLERMRSPELQHIILRNVPAAVAETIAVMNLGRFFRLKSTPPGNPV